MDSSRVSNASDSSSNLAMDFFGHTVEIKRQSFDPLKNDRLLRVLNGEKCDRPPMWAMRQAGRYLPEYMAAKGEKDFFEICRDPELCCKLTLQPINRFRGLIDAAIIFSDILVIPLAIGITVEMQPGIGPVLKNSINSVQDAQNILAKKPNLYVELSYVYNSISLTRKELSGQVPLIGFCGSPWTLIAYMIEGSGSKTFVKSKRFLMQHKEVAKQLLDFIADLCITHLALQVAAGVQAVQCFDSFAGQLSPDDFEEFSLPSLKKIAKMLPILLTNWKLAPVPTIIFAKGAWFALDQLCSIGYNAVSIDWSTRPEFARKYSQKHKVALQGNFDPIKLFDTAEMIKQSARKMMREFDIESHIVNLGHGILPETDPDNLRLFFESCREYAS